MDIPVVTLISVVTHLNWTSVCIIFDQETGRFSIIIPTSNISSTITNICGYPTISIQYVERVKR